MKKIALYDRYQLENGVMPELHGIMVEDCKKKIMDAGDELAGEFYDECSELVPLAERSEYTRLHNACKSGEIDELYITTMSRISRQMSLVTQMCKQMHEFGIKVTFMNEGLTSEQLLNSTVIKGISEAIEHQMGM